MNSLQRKRITQAAILTTIVAAFVMGNGIAFGFAAFILSAITLPVPFALLWFSADVLRSDEWAELEAAENPRVTSRRSSNDASEDAAFGLRRNGTRTYVT